MEEEIARGNGESIRILLVQLEGNLNRVFPSISKKIKDSVSLNRSLLASKI
jgi:hypothetical protein